MFSPDNPIKNPSEDLLGRYAFSKRIATAIANLTNDTSTVIGLYGAWGSGKTSIINMAEVELKQIDPNTIVIRFNPWNRIESINLISEYFEIIKENIDKNLTKMHFSGAKRIAISRVIDAYAESLNGKKRARLHLLSRIISRGSKRQLGSIDEKKKKVSCILKKYDIKILVIIDDIDRLSNAQIRSIFQLVATIADFPNVNYLLSYERSVVEKALSSIQGSNGAEYLEKIIQIPIRTPEINREKIFDILIDRLNSLSKYTTTEQEASEVADRAKVLRYCLFPYIKTIRDLNRYSNILNFELASSRDKVSPVDIAAISAISTFEPNLIKWIVNNKALLCGGVNSSYALNSTNVRDGYKAEIEKILRNKNSDSDNIVMGLSILFPSFGQTVNRSHSTASTEFLRMHKMIAHTEIFDAYFESSIDSYDFPYSLIHSMAIEYDEAEISRIVEESIRSNSFGRLLEGFIGMAEEISANRAPIIFRSFARYTKNTYDSENHAWFSETTRSIDLLNQLLDKVGINEASLLMREIVECFDLDDFIAFASFIVDQERAYDRNGFEKRYLNKALIDLDTLLFIEGKLIRKTQESMNNLSILKKEDGQIPLQLWKKIEPDSYSHHLKHALTQPLGEVLLAKLFTSKWIGANDCSWTIDGNYNTIVTDEEALAGIAEAVRRDDFWTLPYSTIERTAAFSISIENKHRGSVDEIDQSIVDNRIQEWKTNRDS